MFVGVAQVQRGLLLAAHAGAGSVGADGADIAPVGDHFELTILADQQSVGVAGVDQEASGAVKWPLASTSKPFSR